MGNKPENRAVDPRPNWAENSSADNWPIFDVRSILSAGSDPFGQIMEFMSGLKSDDNFIIEASFNLQPLRRLLAARGYASFGDQLNANHWRIFFHAEDVSQAGENLESSEPKTWNEEKQLHVDLRMMEPPGPLVFILGLLDRPGMGKELVVHLAQEPIYLYPELNERGWSWDQLESSSDEIRLLLYCQNPD